MPPTRTVHGLHGTRVHQVEAPNGAVIQVFATRNGTVEVHGPCVDLQLAGVHAFVAALQDSAAEAVQLVAAEPKPDDTIAKPDTPVGSSAAHVDAARQPADAATEASAAQPSLPNAEAVMCVWVDGGALGNPGPAGIGAVVARPSGTVLAEISQDIGWATNNVAKYRAVLAGLERARALDARQVWVYADSQLLVQQLRGNWRVRHLALQSLRVEVTQLVSAFDQVTFEHVPRDRNRHAHRLANQAINAQASSPVPPEGAGSG
jgi:ribonuclease HI